ncbi:MAG: modulator of FtsH protease [Phenylobacterium sp.]|jgi:modulator of FtsH protease
MQQNEMYQTASASSAIEINKVLRNTYSLLAMTLLFSAVVAGIAMSLNVPHPGFIISLVGIYGLMFLVHKTANSGIGVISIFAFTGFLGYCIGPMLNMVIGSGGGDLVMLAMGGTALIFFSLSGYVLTTKKDMSFMGGMMTALVVVLIVGMIANIFLAIPAMSLAISALFILLSSGMILMQTSSIIHGGEKNYILATVTLFVSIYNLFTSLLHLLMAFGGGDD